jgi:DNA repair exonuclease SbcCD ATPase subunit
LPHQPVGDLRGNSEPEKMSQSNPSRNSQDSSHASQPAVLEEHASAGFVDADEVELLRADNAALRGKVEELEQLLALASQETENRWAERQREYESLLEEKSEVIRGLHQKISELRERPSNAGPAASAPSIDQEEVDELLRLKQEIQEQRKQMERDEESMMVQMRQMEMALAKDRAELARQRSELQRLHGELKREMEAASRDGGLRERLTALQRRASGASKPARGNSEPEPPPAAPEEAQDNGQGKNGGLLRRIFGSGQ